MNVKSIAGQLGERRAGFASSSHSAHSLVGHWSLPDYVALTKPRVMMLAVFTALVGLSSAHLALAVDDGRGRTGFPLLSFATLFIERVMDSLQRAVIGPQIEVVVDRALSAAGCPLGRAPCVARLHAFAGRKTSASARAIEANRTPVP